MGFLSGAYGKIMAGKYLRTLQHKETMVQARLRHATREVSNMEKYLNRMEKQAKADVRNYFYGSFPPYGMSQMTSSTSEQQNEDFRAYCLQQQSIQQQMYQAQQWNDYYFESLRETQLEPLKDEEDNIQTELDSLKSQIQLAQTEYEAKKKEEQDGAKNIAPDYTGQGG